MPRQVRLEPGAQPQLRILLGQPRRLQCPADDQQQPVRLERLLDEVVSAKLDRRDCRLDGAMAGDHHDGDVRLLRQQRLQDAEAIEPRPLQPDVEDHQRRAAHPEGRERRVGVAGLPDRIAFVFKDALDQHADVGFVVNDQDLVRHC